MASPLPIDGGFPGRHIFAMLTRPATAFFFPKILGIASIVLCLHTAALAADILPVADGTIYSTNTAVTNQYIIASSSLRGGLEVAAFDTGQYLTFHLALNPYALPLTGLAVNIYGYGNADGAITGADYNAGTFLGTLNLPPNLGYGQDAFFDVTAFVQNVPGAFFGFNLRTDAGTDVFSSLEYNYGKPSRLVATAVPEPSTAVLLLGAGALLLWRGRRLFFGQSCGPPRKKNKRRSALIGFCLLFASSRAMADIYSFEGPPGQPRNTSMTVPQYVEAGMVFKPFGSIDTAPPYRLVRNGGGIALFPENGTAYLQTLVGGSLEFFRLDGAPFNLVSVDLAEYSTVFTSPTVTFKGFRLDGTTASVTFLLDRIIDGTGPIPDFQTFSFDSSFTSFTRVAVATQGFSLDNLVTSAVPEPSTACLAALGGAVAWCFLRRKPAA